MLFWGDTTIPVNTQITSPFTYTIPITKGIVKRIEVYFPWGCAGLVGIQVIRYTWPLFPISREKWLIGNDVRWFDEPYENISEEPYELLVKGYNLDDTYDHTPLIGIEVIKSVETGLVTQFLKTLGVG